MLAVQASPGADPGAEMNAPSFPHPVDPDRRHRIEREKARLWRQYNRPWWRFYRWWKNYWRG